MSSSVRSTMLWSSLSASASSWRTRSARQVHQPAHLFERDPAALSDIQRTGLFQLVNFLSWEVELNRAPCAG